MEKIITYEKIRSYAYVNDKICKHPIKGIVIYFYGLNWNSMIEEDPDDAKLYAENGILYVVPYSRPWAWMNDSAAKYTDEIIDVLFEHYDLSKDTPIVSSGMSMGGMSSIIYAKKSIRTPVACVANCPVCDMIFHYDERADLPRTIYTSFVGESGTLNEVLREHSPLYIVEKLPRISYHIFHCNEDLKVNISRHSEKFVSEMKEKGHNVTFDVVEGKGHCDLTEEMKDKFMHYCIKNIKGDCI